jgi:hypothetical protein
VKDLDFKHFVKMWHQETVATWTSVEGISPNLVSGALLKIPSIVIKTGGFDKPGVGMIRGHVM